MLYFVVRFYVYLIVYKGCRDLGIDCVILYVYYWFILCSKLCKIYL